MRICMIGKYPPIQGGVSALHYFTAHSLARRGHEVHVVTNAREVEPAFRVMMRPDDWARCEADYPGGGAVRVHWTDGDRAPQNHIPWHNPFVSKLASLAAEAIRAHDLQAISSYYLEPYAIAGHLAADITGRPHMVLTAGSDIGRLIEHPQLGPLYYHVFARAQQIATSGLGKRKLRARGIPDERFCSPGVSVPLPEFTPEGPVLDVAAVLRDMQTLDHSPVLPGLCPPERLPRPWIGIYGKHHEVKGTFDLLAAAAVLARRGRPIGLLILGRGFDRVQDRLAREIERLGLADSVLQLPFLPPWRVPEYLRACRAVCYLERDFDIPHGPIVPREILACGRPLVGSAEKIGLDWLLTGYAIHGFNCVAVRDVRDPDELAARLEHVDDEARARAIGARGRALWDTIAPRHRFADELEALYARLTDEPIPGRGAVDSEQPDAADAVAEALAHSITGRDLDDDDAELRRSSDALLFRLDGDLVDDDPGALYPSLLPGVAFRDLPGEDASVAAIRSGHRVVTARVSSRARALIESLDGARTVSELARAVGLDPDVQRAVRQAVMHYFQLGLIALSARPCPRGSSA